MPRRLCNAIVVAFAAAVLLPAAAAQAQWYSSVSRQPAPLYPYAVDTSRPYAVEVAPNTYVIKRPGKPRRPAYSRRTNVEKSARPVMHSNVDRASSGELHESGKRKPVVVNTTRIVREKPVVIEHKRYVEDPPRVIERYTVVDHNKPAHGDGAAFSKSGKKSNAKDTGKRVIQADAEITILGPDRMSIRLFRKGDSRKARAEASVE
jgi:hypothetical protein